MKHFPCTRLGLITTFAVVALVLAACADAGTSTPECEDGELWNEYRLFMGRGLDGSEVVSDADWENFLVDTITPRFPDGLSVLDVAGQLLHEDGSIEKERTKLLLILAPSDTPALEPLSEISEEYKRRFNQDVVLRVVTDACVAFQ